MIPLTLNIFIDDDDDGENFTDLAISYMTFACFMVSLMTHTKKEEI